MPLDAVNVSLTPEEKFREYLMSRSRPQRFTDQQRDLLHHVFARHEHFDADQLMDDLRGAGLNISRATVYRTLKKLVDAGLLRSFELGDRAFYEHDYGYPHHEHLVCNQCEMMIEFQSPTIEAAIQEVCKEHGFRLEGHTLMVRGLCQKCVQARSSKRRLDLI